MSPNMGYLEWDTYQLELENCWPPWHRRSAAHHATNKIT